jgi:hypothetical protein
MDADCLTCVMFAVRNIATNSKKTVPTSNLKYAEYRLAVTRACVNTVANVRRYPNTSAQTLPRLLRSIRLFLFTYYT